MSTATQTKRTKADAAAQFVPDVEVDPVCAGLCVLLSLMIAAKREPGTYKCQAVNADCIEPGLKLAAMFEEYRVTVAPHNVSRELTAFSVKYNGGGRGSERLSMHLMILAFLPSISLTEVLLTTLTIILGWVGYLVRSLIVSNRDQIRAIQEHQSVIDEDLADIRDTKVDKEEYIRANAIARVEMSDLMGAIKELQGQNRMGIEIGAAVAAALNRKESA